VGGPCGDRVPGAVAVSSQAPLRPRGSRRSFPSPDAPAVAPRSSSGGRTLRSHDHDRGAAVRCSAVHEIPTSLSHHSAEHPVNPDGPPRPAATARCTSPSPAPVMTREFVVLTRAVSCCYATESSLASTGPRAPRHIDRGYPRAPGAAWRHTAGGRAAVRLGVAVGPHQQQQATPAASARAHVAVGGELVPAGSARLLLLQAATPPLRSKRGGREDSARGEDGGDSVRRRPHSPAAAARSLSRRAGTAVVPGVKATHGHQWSSARPSVQSYYPPIFFTFVFCRFWSVLRIDRAAGEPVS
jgi:hypothetical protein